MMPITRVLLFISYAVLGLAISVVLPFFLKVEQSLANMIGMLVFFGSWQLQTWLMAAQTEVDAHARLDKIEDVVLVLRKDLERTRREVKLRGREGEEKSQILVSELKLLQTLLTQVSRKELELGKKSNGAEVSEQTEEAALELSADFMAEGDPAPKEDDAAGSVELEWDNDEDQITEKDLEELDLTPDEAAMVVVDGAPDKPTAPKDGKNPQGGQKPTAVKHTVAGKRKAPIRLIKREDQLLKVIRSSLAENRVDLYLQPIVSLPARKTVHYECFSRVRDEEGRIILPRQYMKVAEDKGLIGTIDNLLLFRLIQLVRRLGKRRPEVRFFCNMSRYSMADEEFFPQFIDFMTSNGEFANRLVFEISQDDYNALDENVTDRLQALGRKGFAFSMDMVKDYYQEFSALERQYFRFIKSDMRDLISAHPETGDIDAFKSALRRKSMKLIASRIEDEAGVLHALDAGLEFAQGYLFGEPSLSSDLNSEL